MRFGCCGNLASTHPDGIGIEIIEDAARFGFDYIELPIAEMTALSATAFDIIELKEAELSAKFAIIFFHHRLD